MIASYVCKHTLTGLSDRYPYMSAKLAIKGRWMVQTSLRQAYVKGLNSDIVTFIISASHSDLQQFAPCWSRVQTLTKLFLKQILCQYKSAVCRYTVR